MKLNARDLALLSGFDQRMSFAELRAGLLRLVPREEDGVYAVIYPFDEPPEFLARGTCGDFRGVQYSLTELASW
jgi:hypothetical protein